jgi:hypothetical protein
VVSVAKNRIIVRVAPLACSILPRSFGDLDAATELFMMAIIFADRDNHTVAPCGPDRLEYDFVQVGRQNLINGFQ